MDQREQTENNISDSRIGGLLRRCREENELLSDEIQRTNLKVAECEEYQSELLKRIYYDEKTGLPNHVYLHRDGLHVFSSSQSGRTSAVLFIDLDETYETLLKTQASAISEWVLYKTALWIKDIIGDTGKVYQSRTSEFAIILREVEDEKHCGAIAEKIANRLAETHRFPGNHITVGCSIGCAVFPDHGSDRSILFRNADIALAESKKTKQPWAMFEPTMADDMLERINLKNGILKAFEDHAIQEMGTQFNLVFQPLVRVASLNGKDYQHHPVGAECLIRWNHPTIGMVSPNRFIPLAEESGLIIPIGNWVLYNATQKLVEYHKLGHDNLYMSINLSPRQFKDPYLVENVERVLTSRGLEPGSIQLEITETSIMDDPTQAVKKLETMQEMGVKLSIDDFGTGYSSLNYLKNLKVDSLKIDKSFVDDVVTNTQNQGIVRAIISMARSLGLDILAEGIEDYGQLEFIHREGCSNIQGYYFSKPLTDGEFLAYLSSQ